MNPPFTNRASMGEKFPKHVQQLLRTRVDAMEQNLVTNDGFMGDFVDKNSLEPLFTALGDRCLNDHEGVMTTITPTVALCATSALNKRMLLAQRFHIHTIVTCHQPRNINLSQNTNINESILIASRHKKANSPTRFIALEKLPTDEFEIEDLHRCLSVCEQGQIEDGWGEISYWPAELMENGDWTPAIWRSPDLAKAAVDFASCEELQPLSEFKGMAIHKTGATLYGPFEKTDQEVPGSFPVLGSKGADGQRYIRSMPDQCWSPKSANEGGRHLDDATYQMTGNILAKAGYVLITFGQDNSTARLTATASDSKYVGTGWMPITGVTPKEAKALAVFMNSTPGRLQLMRNTGRKLSFPIYNPAAIQKVLLPNIKDRRIRGILGDCWERTKDMFVPQFRDGECEVRRLWDEAVAEAMGWDANELSRLRNLLHKEPHVSGLGYNQYADELED